MLCLVCFIVMVVVMIAHDVSAVAACYNLSASGSL